jgi:hypothetical protein
MPAMSQNKSVRKSAVYNPTVQGPCLHLAVLWSEVDVTLCAVVNQLKKLQTIDWYVVKCFKSSYPYKEILVTKDLTQNQREQ